MKSEVLVKFVGDTKSVDSAMKGLNKGVSNGVSRMAKSMAPASAAATGLLAGIVKTGVEFEKSMTNVQAISGATAKDMKKLEAKAREMGKATVFSASESADALGYMALAGWKTQDMLKGLPGVLNLAAAGNTDLALTSDIVTDSLTAFKMSAEDSTRIADVMAATMSNSNTTIEMLGESFKYAAPLAGTLGQSVEDTSLALGLMANAGIKSSQAGTSLRQVFSRLSTDTGNARTNLEKLGVQVFNQDGTMRSLKDIIIDTQKAFKGLSNEQQTALAKSIAGQTGMSGFLAMVNATEKDTNKLAEAIANSGGAAQKMADTMNQSTSNQLKILMSEVSELALQFADILLPVLKAIVKGATKVVQGLQKMSPTMRTIIATILVVVAALAPVLAIVGKVIGAVTKVFSIVSRLIPIVKILFGIIVANPIVAIIVGVIAALVLLWTKCEWFRNAVKAAIDWIWNFIKTTFGLIVTIFKAHVQIFLSIVQGIWAGIKTTIGLIVAGIKLHIQIIVSVIKGIITVVSAVMNSIKNGFKAAFNFVASVVRGYINTVLAIIRTIWNVASSIINKVKNGFKVLGSGIKSVFSSVANFIRNVFSRIGGYVKAPINAVIRGLNRIKLPSWVPGLGGKGINIPYLATGTNYVPADTLAMIHKGEAVVPKKFNPYANDIKPQTLGGMNAGSGTTIVNNIDVKVEQDPLGQMVNKIKTYSGGAKNDYNYGMGV